MNEVLRIDAIRVGYPTDAGLRIVVDELSLTLGPGDIGCLLGASGCGKTTVLRAIAGFEPISSGRIVLVRAEIATPRTAVPPQRRGVGMLFQDYALFPHLRTAANVGFGLSGLERDARARRVAEMLALVGLTGSATAYPHELSGGQQQRVALARALAPAPALLLLDEPFSNLDIDTRRRLAPELRALLKSTGTTVLMVTHDQTEAFAMADRIGVMAAGRIAQWDDAATLYAHPATRFVAGFIGGGAWIAGAALGLSGEVEVLLRPHQLVVTEDGPLRATLVAACFRGPHHVGTLRFPTGDTVDLDLTAAHAARIGETLTLRLATDDLISFPRT